MKLESTRGDLAPKLYTFLVALTVLAEVTVVFVSTAAGVRLSAGGFNPMATDPISFLIREFEATYLTIRVNFFSGLIAFLAALGVRAWTTFPGSLGNAIGLFLLSGVLNMLSFFNSTVVNYKFGLLGLGWRLTQLYVARVFTCPIGVASVIALAGGSIFTVKAFQEGA